MPNQEEGVSEARTDAAGFDPDAHAGSVEELDQLYTAPWRPPGASGGLSGHLHPLHITPRAGVKENPPW